LTVNPVGQCKIKIVYNLQGGSKLAHGRRAMSMKRGQHIPGNPWQ
jgi:hypothetical protein